MPVEEKIDSLLATQHLIKQKIKEFDVSSLIKLLESLGYRLKDVHFQSNSSLSSASALCEDIYFSDQSYPRVTIVINIGLLSGNSPLPSFFRKKMDSGVIDPVLFGRFINFFDHYIISNLLSISMAEDNGWFFSDWQQTLHQYLTLLALNSGSTLAFLFQLCFPEIKVEVMKFRRVMSLQSSSTALGTTLLGKDSYLGKNEKLTLSSFRIILTAEEILTDLSMPWAFEIKKRIKELIFPVLEHVSVYMQIILIVRNGKDSTRLSGNSHLGYCSIGANDRFLQLLLFSGYPKDLLEN